MQKFINYEVPVAIVIENPASYGPRVEELSREHARRDDIRTFCERGEAEVWLSSRTR